jgi:hypothetical protein
MRTLLFTTAAIAAIAAPSVAGAQYYSTNPPSIVVTPAPPVASPYGFSERPVYLAPGAQYEDAPIYIEGQRYYRDCWWDWGRRKCELKRWY